MRYTIIESIDVAVLCQKINELLFDGWQPLGGVSVVKQYDTKINYVQAMIKESYLK